MFRVACGRKKSCAGCSVRVVSEESFCQLNEDLCGLSDHQMAPLSISASVQVGFDSKLSGNYFARMTKILFSFLALPSRIDGQLSCWCAELM